MHPTTTPTRWLRWPVLLVAVCSLLAAGCAAEEEGATDGEGDTAATGDETGATDAGDGEASGEPILIGVNIEQSGGASVQGQAYANAVQLLADRINEEGGIDGRPVELSIVDNGTDQTEAVTLTRRLADEGAVAMIGPGTSPTTLAAMEAITDTGIPTFSMGSSTAIVQPVEERSNVFKTPAGSEANVRKLLEHLEGTDIDQIGVIAVNNPYGDAGIEAWQQIQESGEHDFELVGVEKFESGDTDMTGQLNSLVDAGAEAIAAVAIPPGAPTIQRNAVENLGLEIPIYYDAGAGAELFIELAGEAANGAFVTHPPTLVWDELPEDHPQYEVLQAFGEAYTSEYGAMSGFAGYAWDALAMLKRAIEDAGSTESEAIVEALENMGEYVGVDGTYEIGPDDHQGLTADDLVIVTVEDGEWQLASEEGDA